MYQVAADGGGAGGNSAAAAAGPSPLAGTSVMWLQTGQRAILPACSGPTLSVRPHPEQGTSIATGEFPPAESGTQKTGQRRHNGEFT
jgi:hypothetical protein